MDDVKKVLAIINWLLDWMLVFLSNIFLTLYVMDNERGVEVLLCAILFAIWAIFYRLVSNTKAIQ